jgi:hypothetical protein
MFGGESAFDVDEDWQDKDLVEECMSVLRKVSKAPPPTPLDYVVTRWGQDALCANVLLVRASQSRWE